MFVLILEVDLEDADTIRDSGEDAEAESVAVEIGSDARAEVVRHLIGAKVDFQEDADREDAQDWAGVRQEVDDRSREIQSVVEPSN